MLLLLAASACLHPVTLPAEGTLNEEAARGVTHPALRSLLSDHWESLLARSPLMASRLGDHRYDMRVDDLSAAAIAAEHAAREAFLRRARALDGAALQEADRTTLELFTGELRLGLATDACHAEEWGLSARSNPLVTVGEVADILPIVTPEDATNYLARLGGLPEMIAADVYNLRRGIATGRTPDARSVAIVLTQLDSALLLPAAEWPAAGPGLQARPTWPDARRVAFRVATRTALEEGILPALRRYRTFLAAELLPAARGEDRTGVWALPGGDVCYTALIESHTSLPLRAADLHATGLSELEGIHAEMRVLGQRLFGISELPALFAHLREDPALRFRTEAEVEAKAGSALAAARARIPSFFGRLPQAECEVRRIPEYEAAFTTIAYYRPVVPGEQPGYYYVNTYAPESRPRFEAEVLAFHESIPGHHLQIAIAQDLPALPAFRRHLGTTAFVEGWALYTERLADEMGLYSGDLDRLGMLSFDAWRAARLVVDTGIHAMRWDRGQAERFFLENTPLAANNVTNEVDRYITWPGQALAYKTGQIALRTLRAEAEAALGPRFSLPAFHDVVLGGGAVSLPVLQRRVRAWAASE